MSSPIQEQALTLHRVRKIDAEVLRLERGIQVEIPEAEAELEAKLSTQKQTFDQAEAALKDYEKSLKEAEMDHRSKEAEVQKAEAKMMEVKTNDEYRAAVRENDDRKKAIGQLEDRVLSLMSDLEGRRTEFKTTQSEFQTFEKEIQAKKQELEAEKKKLQSLLDEKLTQKEAACKDLGSVGALYQRLSKNLKGTKIGVVEASRCLSCNLSVQPQLYNEVISYKAIHQCPNCHRILLPRLEEESTQDDAKANAEVS